MKDRTKALSIPIEVKKAVAERDNCDGWACCIICGRPAPTDAPLSYSCAHFRSRAQGGLGIERNILTLCPKCHRQYDQSPLRSAFRPILLQHLKTCYPDFDESELIYKK